MPTMRIVIPSALPPPAYAGELAKILPDKAPALVRWLSRASADVSPFDVEHAGCTAFEAWQLEHAGYSPDADLPLAAGLGPLHLAAASRTLPAPADAPVWLAEFCHLALGADQAMLVPAVDIAPTPDEAQALFAAILPIMQDAGFDASRVDATRLRIVLPDGVRPSLSSPQAVAGHALRAWWQTDAAMRPWRRLLTEIQMTWHAHPVNEAREAAGRPTINALWLYGGARPWAGLDKQLGADAPRGDTQDSPSPPTAGPALQASHGITADPLVDLRLVESARQGDWASWLDDMAALDHAVFRPLSGSDGGPAQATVVLLLGEHRRARLDLAPRSRLLGWLPHPNKDWKHWWSLPA